MDHRPSHEQHMSWSQREIALLQQDLGLPLDDNTVNADPNAIQGDITLHERGDTQLARPSESCNSSRMTVAPGSEEPQETVSQDTTTVEVNDIEPVDGFHLTREGDTIWVDFSTESFRDPMHFSQWRKWTITIIAILFTFWTAANVGAFASGETSMMRDLHATGIQAAAGLGLYAWGFAIFPLVLAPFSEEFGRRPMYIGAILLYWLCHFGVAAAQNITTVLVFRFLSGGFGSVGATLVGGSLADLWKTSERGSKMGMFAFCAVFGTSIAPVGMAWVEMNPKLEWRWIQWIQIILVGAYLPLIPLLMPETRSTVILRRMAKRLGNERSNGLQEKGAKYTARSEVGKIKLSQLLKISLVRPLYLLATEPTVTFFSIWIAVGWGVLYGEVQSIPYVFMLLYGFDEGHVGLVYLSLAVGCILAFLFNFCQEWIYRRKVAERGAEARLYAAMVGGVFFAIGCFIYAWTAFTQVTYVAPCIGIVVILFGIFSIYLAVFNYLADSYGVYASSALAGQSFLRNMIAGAFPFFTETMYRNLSPHWASTLFGCLAAFLALVPFLAFFYGPKIREKSNFSRKLIAEQEKMEKAKEAWGQEKPRIV